MRNTGPAPQYRTAVRDGSASATRCRHIGPGTHGATVDFAMAAEHMTRLLTDVKVMVTSNRAGGDHIAGTQRLTQRRTLAQCERQRGQHILARSRHTFTHLLTCNEAAHFDLL